jgi:hypothetical protein
MSWCGEALQLKLAFKRDGSQLRHSPGHFAGASLFSRYVMSVYDLSHFTESESSKRIAINPQLVRFVIEIDDKRVGIVFD